ncbi:MAG TPA: DNA-formamidopyrimidine glycosylase family protein [Thermoleophilaceae bacterium]|jgi:endonuclease-8|nr:DNA-formamidopyrimidine glycosylase family protein [Thermoleophilaceae bacterium]
MPEGDTVHRAAQRVAEALVGKEILSIEAPQPRHRFDRLPERLGGRRVRAVEVRGKHLLLRFDGGLSVHSHLGMGGSWAVHRRGERWRRSAPRAWVVFRTRDHDVVQFDGPVLELMSDARTRSDPRIAGLGPDVLAPELQEDLVLRALRSDDPRRPIGDALLDQRNVAGIGNIWRSEACFAAGLDPWRRLAELDDDELLRPVRAARELMRRSLDGSAAAPRSVYGRAGLPCRSCGSTIARRRMGDFASTVYWCPECQR